MTPRSSPLPRGLRILFAVGLVITVAASVALVAALGVDRHDPPDDAAALVPPGFRDEKVATVRQPTDLAVTPDGRMLVIGKTGLVRVIDADGRLLDEPAIDLGPRLCTTIEQGLSGIAVHPDFGVSNRWIYLYFTLAKHDSCEDDLPTSPVNRLARFELGDDNRIDPDSETVLFDTSPLVGKNHNAGQLRFGPDGMLWVTVGDGMDLPGAARPDRLLGKLLRLTDDGGIPPDGNAFTGEGTARCNVAGVPPEGSAEGTACREIYALGLRNPFRFVFDPSADADTPRLLLMEVGRNTWEEIDEVTGPGGDYGWPDREGPCAFESVTDCDPVPGLIDPIHWYRHPDGGSAAITGAAFVPPGVWPAEYDGALLFADFVQGRIFRLLPRDPDEACRTCDPPVSPWRNDPWAETTTPVTLLFRTDDDTPALYYLNRSAHQVRRITHNG